MIRVAGTFTILNKGQLWKIRISRINTFQQRQLPHSIPGLTMYEAENVENENRQNSEVSDEDV